MPSITNALDEARDLVKKRLAELDDERRRLERALAELGGKATRRAGPPERLDLESIAPPKTTRRRRRRRGGTRADQAVELIKKNPGITASEIAKSMKIKPNYLYRVLSDLEKQKKVKKKGRTYTRLLAATGRPARLRADRAGRRRRAPRAAPRRWHRSCPRENSGISSPSTTDHSPPEQLHGRPATIPSSTP